MVLDYFVYYMAAYLYCTTADGLCKYRRCAVLTEAVRTRSPQSITVPAISRGRRLRQRHLQTDTGPSES